MYKNCNKIPILKPVSWELIYCGRENHPYRKQLSFGAIIRLQKAFLYLAINFWSYYFCELLTFYIVQKFISTGVCVRYHHDKKPNTSVVLSMPCYIFMKCNLFSFQYPTISGISFLQLLARFIFYTSFWRATVNALMIKHCL